MNLSIRFLTGPPHTGSSRNCWIAAAWNWELPLKAKSIRKLFLVKCLSKSLCTKHPVRPWPVSEAPLFEPYSLSYWDIPSVPVNWPSPFVSPGKNPGINPLLVMSGLSCAISLGKSLIAFFLLTNYIPIFYNITMIM